ncbi:MAG: hypothetical protein IJC30_03280 [Alphaproteobacteria bacterium]|nr:hypothetical protein [Alphaproteobacteria bacterium]
MKKRFVVPLFLFFCALACMSDAVAYTKVADSKKVMKEIKKVQAGASVKSYLKNLAKSIREFYRAVGDPSEEETESEYTESETDYGEMQFGVIYGEVLKKWAKPILSEDLQDALEEADVLDGDGNLKESDSQIKKVRDFVMTELLPFKTKGNDYVPLEGEKVTKEKLDAMNNLRLEVLKNAVADAYSLSITSQYQMANFNQSILLPFKEELETSEDLQQRIKKNTWIILALFSQINLDNILSVSATRVQASSILDKQPMDFHERGEEDNLFYKDGEEGGEF